MYPLCPICHSIHPLEVVGRGSETQLQVGENLSFIVQRSKDPPYKVLLTISKVSLLKSHIYM